MRVSVRVCARVSARERVCVCVCVCVCVAGGIDTSAFITVLYILYLYFWFYFLHVPVFYMRHPVNAKSIHWTGIIIPALPPVLHIQNIIMY